MSHEKDVEERKIGWVHLAVETVRIVS